MCVLFVQYCRGDIILPLALIWIQASSIPYWRAAGRFPLTLAYLMTPSFSSVVYDRLFTGVAIINVVWDSNNEWPQLDKCGNYKQQTNTIQHLLTQLYYRSLSCVHHVNKKTLIKSLCVYRENCFHSIPPITGRHDYRLPIPNRQPTVHNPNS